MFLCLAHGGSIGRWQGRGDIFLSEANAHRLLKRIRRRSAMKIDFSTNLSLRPGCPAAVEKIYITPYGDVLPCTFNPISFGNLRRSELAGIWKEMVAFRRRHADPDALCLRSYDAHWIDSLLAPLDGRRLPVAARDLFTPHQTAKHRN